LTVQSDEEAYGKYMGDICKYLSEMKATNGSGLNRNWVMPVSNDFGRGTGGSLGSEFIINDMENGVKYENRRKGFWNGGTSEFTSLDTAKGVDGRGFTATTPAAALTYTTTTSEEVTFPASGYRNVGYGALTNVGYYGYYWSSSVYDASYAYYLYFYSSRVYPGSYGDRAFGQSVRCVQEL
jgi:uncharacterized protein (TIGR02145 family)